MEKRYFSIKGKFELESGESLDSPTICYHISKNRQKGQKVIWICHALTANSNPTEWWSDLVGEGKLFDPNKYLIVCANMLGSPYGSSSPVSPSPNGEPYMLSFPKITVRDIVVAHNHLRKELAIGSIDLMVGASIGGFQALEWSIIYPQIIQNLLLIACNAVVSPWGSAFNESQRMALEADSTFREQKSIEGGKKGLEAARSIALLSYRSAKGYNITQTEESNDFIFASKANSYQRYQGAKLSARFDAYSYYTLTKCIDSHNCGRGRGGVERALKRVKANTVVVGITDDVLFPVSEQHHLANHIPGASFELIDSLYGHDGFLIEYPQTINIISKHFKL